MSLSRPKPNNAAVSDAYSMGSTAYRADPHQSANHTASASKAAQDMKNSIAEMVVDLASEVAAKEIDARAHSDLIDEAIDSLGDDL